MDNTREISGGMWRTRYDARAEYAAAARRARRERRERLQLVAIVAGGVALALALGAALVAFIGSAQPDYRGAALEAGHAVSDGRPAVVPTADGGTVTIPAAELQQCEHEGARGCIWVATLQGNGQGQSFHADTAGGVTYLGGSVAAAITGH